MTKGRPKYTPWQSRCLAQLKASAAGQPDTLQITAPPAVDDETGQMLVRFRLTTRDIPRRPRGLPLADTEDLVVAIEPDDDRPPTVYVEHYRFLGHPHVLSGFQLCLYLDETREWDPSQGMNGVPNGVLNRLWRWLEKGALRGFNADEALYHAVGGFPPLSRRGVPLPPIVVRELSEPRSRVASAWLTPRAPWCLELTCDKPDGQVAEQLPVFFADRDLPFGAGHNYLIELTDRLDLHYIRPRPHLVHAPAAYAAVHAARPEVARPCGSPNCPDLPLPPLREVPRVAEVSPAVAMLTALAASASRKPAGSPQTLLIAVPHPLGGPRHLVAVYFDPALGDGLRRLVATRTTPLITFNRARLDGATPLRWCYVSDERPEVTKRRDIGRPVAAYLDKTVLVWGIGGIGSWVAEYIVRAGAKRVTVCDTGMVTGGLLVRQNYVDTDIGASKAERLEARLNDISPTTDIHALHKISDDELASLATKVDLIIDATINRVVGHRLDALTKDKDRTCTIAHIATDTRTGTLGLAIVNGPSSPATLSDQDKQTGHAVEDDPSLEAYRTFWSDPEPGDEFVPTRGCSLPTFHGSAADLAAIAASLTTLIAPHLEDGASGSHLVALPHSGVSPAHSHIPAS